MVTESWTSVRGGMESRSSLLNLWLGKAACDCFDQSTGTEMTLGDFEARY